MKLAEAVEEMLRAQRSVQRAVHLVEPYDAEIITLPGLGSGIDALIDRWLAEVEERRRELAEEPGGRLGVGDLEER